MVSVKNKRRYYHVSVFDHGDVLNVRRVSPLDPDHREPGTPRLCVAPSVPQCLCARMMRPGRPAYVYRSEPRKGITPKGVWDSLITEERWIAPPDKLEKVDTICGEDMSLMFGILEEWHLQTGSAASVHLRIATLAHAWNVFGDRFAHSPWDRRVAESLAKGFDVDFDHPLSKLMDYVK